MMNLNVLSRIGHYSFISALVITALLLLVVYIPILSGYLIFLAGLLLLSGGLFFATTLGLCIMLTNEAEYWVIPGIYKIPLHPWFARIFGWVHLFMGSVAIVVGMIVLIAAIAN
ncbi:MAG TPA: hypothetical protein IGS40_10415 [Trichormus sp. M33_DOE_039]|nr:hypothetical protein [Trichormus sp. M33_DOE_039]